MAAIQHSSGINYTLYFNTLNYFKTIMSNHPSIEVVTQGDMSDFDTKEFPAYPIGNVQITEAIYGDTVTNWTIELTVADKIKNKNNDSTGSSNEQTIAFYGVDDTVDIHANTLSILNDLTAYTQKGVDGFEINDDIICTPFSDRFNNGLAGWQATFTLTTHNDKNRCLFFLIEEAENGFLITDCITGQDFSATISIGTGQVVGKVFATYINAIQPADYGNLKCFQVDRPLANVQWNFNNLPMINWPYPDGYDDCSECELWINPKVWSTTPAKWSGEGAEFRTWATV
jgi:hypothetical protein